MNDQLAATLFVLAWTVWLGSGIVMIQKPSVPRTVFFVSAYLVFLGIDIWYAIYTEQYVFVFIPIVIIFFSILMNKAVEDATQNS